MSDNNETGIKLPLGVLGIIRESFSVFFQRAFLFLTLTIVMQLFVLLITYFLQIGGLSGTAGPFEIFTFGQGGMAGLVANFISLIGYSYISLVITLVAFDVKTNTNNRIGYYLSSGLKALFPAILLMIVVLIIVGIPIALMVLLANFLPLSMFLIGPVGIFLVLYFYGMFSVINPSLVIEGTGFRSFSRSMELTRNYRRHIIGLYFVLLFVLFLLSSLFGIAIAFSLSSGSGGFGSTFGIVTIIGQVLSAILVTYFAIVVALLFARLKEIKEGYGFVDVGDVFS